MSEERQLPCGDGPDARYCPQFWSLTSEVERLRGIVREALCESEMDPAQVAEWLADHEVPDLDDEAASIPGDATPVLVTWDPGEETTDHIDQIADAVRVQSGGRVIITMTDIADSDCHAVIGSRLFTDDEALALLDAEAGDPQ